MTSPHCEKVKRGDESIADFDSFLQHVNDCRDCQRRIASQMVVKFNQKKMGDE